jgi:hypothetical protein
MKELMIGDTNGTKLTGKVVLPDGTEIDSDEAQTPISDEVYYIVPGKCTECKGFTMNHNVLQFVLWTVVFLTIIM